jgi:hypothetical protein
VPDRAKAFPPAVPKEPVCCDLKNVTNKENPTTEPHCSFGRRGCGLPVNGVGKLEVREPGFPLYSGIPHHLQDSIKVSAGLSATFLEDLGGAS